MTIFDPIEIAEILDQADWQYRSLDTVQRTLLEVAQRLNIPIKVSMREPENSQSIRVLYTERKRSGSACIYKNVTKNENIFVCHTQVYADRFETPFVKISDLVRYILEIHLPAEVPTRIRDETRWRVIKNRGLQEAWVIADAARRAAKGCLLGLATASEIAEALDNRFTTDTTHMSIESFIESIENHVKIIERELKTGLQ